MIKLSLMKRLPIFFILLFLSPLFAQSPTTQPLPSDALSEIQIAFHPSVFSGKKFPNYDFTEPHLVHELRGHSKLGRGQVR